MKPFKCNCGLLTAEGREACGDGMSQVAKQGNSPTAAGQAHKEDWPVRQTPRDGRCGSGKESNRGVARCSHWF
jgi:hypothetical protein